MFFTIRTGPEFSTTIVKPETELTASMFASESWKTQTFKPYNFDAMGVKPTYGTLHPLLKVRAEIRSNFLEMGYKTREKERGSDRRAEEKDPNANN